MKIQRVAARIALLLACSQFSTLAAEPVDMAKRAEELKSLKWGMFVCWSFSTFSGKEWSPGVKDLALFKATEVDTDQWARTAKEAGMGYIDFLTKHHDGFCLWDTKTTQRKVTKAPLGKDVLRLLQQSCDKYGIKLALYFSENEFEDNKDYHPGGYSVEMKKAQLKELLTEYGPIEYIWFDTQVGKAVVVEASFPRTQEFAIEYKDGDSWKPVVTGTMIAGNKTYEFKPVKARYFRLNIIKANEVPTIDEFQLY